MIPKKDRPSFNTHTKRKRKISTSDGDYSITKCPEEGKDIHLKENKES